MTDQSGPGQHEATHPDGPGQRVDARMRPPARPRWVIWLVIGIVVAVLVVLGVHLIMGGGPMDHRSGMNHALPAWGVRSGLGGYPA